MIKIIVYYMTLINLILLSFGCIEIIRDDYDIEILKPEIKSLYPEGIVYSTGGFKLKISCKNVTDDFEVYINGKKIKSAYKIYRSPNIIECDLSDEDLNEIFLNHDKNNFKFNVRVLNNYTEEKPIPVFELGSHLSMPKELKIDWDNTVFSAKRKLFSLWKNSIDPILKLNKNGFLCLTWREKTNDMYQAFFSFSEDEGETWSQVLNISRSDRNVSIVDMVIDEENNFYMVWSEEDDSNSHIFFCKSIDEGLTWFNPITLSDNNFLSFNPAITVNENGGISIIWQSKNIDSESKDIYFANSIDKGKNWKTKQIIQHKDMQIGGTDNYNKSILKAGTDDILYLITTWRTEQLVLSRSRDAGNTWKNMFYRSGHNYYNYLMNINLCIGKNNDPFIIWTRFASDKYYSGPSTYLSRGFEFGEIWNDDISINESYIGYHTTMSVKDNEVDLILRSYKSLFYIHSDDEGRTWKYPQMIPGTYSYTRSPSMVKDTGNLFLVYISTANYYNKHGELYFIKGNKSISN